MAKPRLPSKRAKPELGSDPGGAETQIEDQAGRQVAEKARQEAEALMKLRLPVVKPRKRRC